MALKLYFDSAATEPIAVGTEDEYKDSGESGYTLQEEKAIYMKSDNTDLTYENIAITKDSVGGTPSVTPEYAPDVDGSAGTYVSTYEPPDGAYTTEHKFWVRATVTNVTEAFKRDNIDHEITADEHVV